MSAERHSCMTTMKLTHITVVILTLVASAPIGSASADAFARAYFDAVSDELVVTFIYQGTNPDHTFSLAWGKCRNANTKGMHQLAVRVLDSQWSDAALRDYQKTVRFNLSKLKCRPAELTLLTAPRFRYTLLIPASGGH